MEINDVIPPIPASIAYMYYAASLGHLSDSGFFTK